MAPVLQFRNVVAGVDIFCNEDASAIYFLPLVSLGELRKQKIGQKLLLQGQVNYEVSSDLIDAIRLRFPKSTILPVIAEDASVVDPFSMVMGKHSYVFRVVQQIPFPQFIFSATIDISNQEGKDLVQRVSDLWTDVNSFKSALKLKVRVRDLSIFFVADIDNEYLRKEREALPLHGITSHIVDRFLNHAVMDGNGVKLKVVIGGVDIPQEWARSHVQRSHFVFGSRAVVLDDGNEVGLWSQLQIRPGDLSETYTGLRGEERTVELEV